MEVKGKLATREEAPVLVVAPHSTYFDGFAVFWADLPYIISRQENRSIPLIGKCTELSQSLFVCREDPQSRQKTVKKIVERCQDGSGWPQLMIFPEGSTSNRKALMSFKPGAFVPGKPVQPVLIRYELFIGECTLHIRVVLSKKLNLHFLFLISSLGYKIKGISSKTCFLNIEKILEEIV